MSARMKAKEFVSNFLLGDDSRRGRDIEGEVVIEGDSEDRRLVLEDLDLENADIYGGLRIRNVTFTGSVNLYKANIHNGSVYFENVTVDGDLALPQNILEVLSDNRLVVFRNVTVAGEIQFSTP